MRTVVGFDQDSDIKYREQTPGGTLLKLANIDANEALELYLDRFAAKEVAGLLADRHGWTVVEASDYWLDCVAALEEERSKWGRAELLLERACEELVGRGVSTAAEACAAAAISSVLGLIAEDFHPLHKKQVEARQGPTAVVLACPECGSTNLETVARDAGGGWTASCINCGADFGKGRAAVTEHDAHR